MTSVVDIFQRLLPAKRKSSPSGWTSFNAPCCHHRGHSPDTRKRAGVRFDGNGIVYNCFNCKFSTGWQPGSPLGEKIKSLSRWLGANEEDIREMVFESLKAEAPEYQHYHASQNTVSFEEKSLPEGSLSLKDWALLIHSVSEESVIEQFTLIVQYLIDRGFENPFDYDFYWSPLNGYETRVIIPFRWQNKIVGCTARKIVDGKPKYISDQHPNFVFNFDYQHENQKYIFVCEGPFDALSIGGVALLTNDIADQQARIINSLGAEVVVVPDQDKAGLVLFDRAAELNWSIAMPNWSSEIKDVADAVKKYGKLFVVVDLLKNLHKGHIKITLSKNNQKKKLEILENEKNN